MRKTTYIILAAALLLLVLSPLTGWHQAQREHATVKAIHYGAVVSRPLPAFAHLVITSRFTPWYDKYVSNMSQGFSIACDAEQDKNCIDLPGDIMRYSSFKLSGDTLYVVLGCSPEMARSYMRKEKGTYRFLPGYYPKSDPHICLHMAGARLASVSNCTALYASLTGFMQDSLLVESKEQEYHFYHCMLRRLHTPSSALTLEDSTHVGQLYMNIDHQQCTVLQGSTIDEYFLEGHEGNVSSNLPDFTYDKPFTLHWKPLKRELARK